MSTPPHLQIFTPVRTAHDDEPNFHPFPRLPGELRRKIWRYSLQRQRIIKLNLIVKGQLEQAPESTDSASLKVHYRAFVDSYQVLSKLLRVSCESREAALEFYRVKIPCTFSGGGRAGFWDAEANARATTMKERSGTFYFNPEYDFFHIGTESSLQPVKDTLVEFLYHLKTTYDPRHVGLLNWALDLNTLNGNDFYLLQPSHIDAEVKAAFVETLAQLQEVFFVSTPRGGRHILGWRSGIPTSETILNRSFPIVTMTPTFERLQRDPRPIDQDLKQVFVGTWDQRDAIVLWQKLLTKWGVSAPRIEYRFCLAFEPSTEIYAHTCARNYLQKEDDAWNGVEIPEEEKTDFSRRMPVGADHEKYKNEDLKKAVRPAFGFWLFPVDALGLLQEEGVSKEEGYISRPKALLDMSEHWPELGLSSLH